MATLLNSASFDAGDFSDFDSTVDVDGDMTVGAAGKLHGSNGVSFLTDNATEMTMRWTLTAASKHYISWWMKLPAVTVSVAAAWRLLTFTWQAYLYVRFETDGTCSIRYDNYGAFRDYQAASVNYLDGQWHRWEALFDKDGAGYVKVDGTQEATATGTGAGTVNALRIGNSGAYGNVSYTVLMDSIELYDDEETALLWPALPSTATLSSSLADVNFAKRVVTARRAARSAPRVEMLRGGSRRGGARARPGRHSQSRSGRGRGRGRAR